jgi:4-hydroxybenzoate polyprenyltransferase
MTGRWPTGLIRLVHPFPSLLTSSATVAIATLAGADVPAAIRLGLAMLAMQCSIGALNDLVDAPLDAVEKPRKPIPDGLVTHRLARVVAVVGAALGVGLSALSGPTTALAAIGCLGLGYAYDVRLSRTALSWLPLSLALPLLPIHAWLGATGSIPSSLLTLIPVAVLAGAGLSISNGLVDVERDARGGRGAAAVTLGRARAWALQAGLLGVAAGLALVLAPSVLSDTATRVDPGVLGALRLGGTWLGALLIALGAVALGAGRPAVRERGWELQAVGVAALGLGWLAGTVASG